MANPARGTALSVLSAIVLALAPAVSAQLSPPSRGANRGAVGRGAAQMETLTTFQMVALEGAIDEDAYIVGPGDVFSVTVGGSLALQAQATVSADGLLVVPSVGTFRAAERSLNEVRGEVLSGLRRQFANVQTGVALAVPRLFYIHVTGAVPRPGRHLIAAVGRVEDALAVATADPDRGPDPRFASSPRDLALYGQPSERRVERRPALRNVRVVDRAGNERRVDLARYFSTGDLDFNPTLRDGDAITLPTFDPDREGVFVDGAVDRPGTYDWRPGDTAADLLAVAAGADLDGRVAGVRRTRRGAESVEVGLAQARSLEILPRDGVYAVAADPDAGQASVIGEGVRFPGTYPITAGRTTLAALVEMAGGLSPDALPRGAALERRARSEAEETVDARALGFADRVTSRSLDTLATDVGTLSSLPLVGRRYYTQEVRRTPRLAVDLEAALAGGPSDVLIQDGDRLVVPRDLGAVRVFGQVGRSGYVAYSTGRSARDYVEDAGGLGPVATEVYVVDAATGRLTAGADGVVQPGDAVFVDRQPTADNPQYESLAIQQQQIERQDARDRRQTRFQLIQTTISAIGTVLTAISIISLISSRNGD